MNLKFLSSSRSVLGLLFAGLLFSSFCSLDLSGIIGQTLSARMQFLATHWEDISSETNLEYESIHSWLPDEGIRGRYEIAKSVLSKATVEGIVGETVFVSGPHQEGMDFTSTTDFGRYNPAFLLKLKQMLLSIYGNQTFVHNTQEFYDQYLQRYLRTYYLAYQVGVNNQAVIDQYLQALSQESPDAKTPYPDHSELLQESFRGFAESIEKEGYDVYEGFVCPGFWVRRAIDGTADEFYDLLLFTLHTYDRGFVD